LITNYPNVVIQGTNNGLSTWNAASYNGNTYPVILHYPSITTGSLAFNLQGNDNIVLNGFVYTNSQFGITYSGKSTFTLNGMLMAGSLGNLLPNQNGTFKINYTNDYYSNPPPHFSSPSGYYYLPGSYREEY
jgi:hypothetical protein